MRLADCLAIGLADYLLCEYEAAAAAVGLIMAKGALIFVTVDFGAETESFRVACRSAIVPPPPKM